MSSSSSSSLANRRYELYIEAVHSIFMEGNDDNYRRKFSEFKKLADPLELLPHQHEIYRIFLEQLQTKKLMIDLSELGSGKSYVLMKLALELDLTVLYISNDLAVKTMNLLMCRYGVRQLPSLTFTEATALENSSSNIYITVTDKGRVPNKNYFNLLSNTRVLVVVDEAQAGKNGDAQRSEALRVMLSPIYYPHNYSLSDNGSRVALLSGTLFDSKLHAKEMIYLTNVTGSCEYTRSIFQEREGQRDFLNAGFGELIFNCYYIDAALTSNILGGVVFDAGGIPQQIGIPYRNTVNDIVYDLYARVVLPYYARGINKPPCVHRKYGRNVRQILSPQEENEVYGYFQSNSNKWFLQDGRIGYPGNSSNFHTSLQDFLHNIKGRHIVRQVDKELKMGMKCVVYTDFNASTATIVDGLKEKGWNVVVIDGKTRTENRYRNIQLFNEDKNTHVIVCKKTIAACSINLHCKKTLEEGGEVRSMHMIPSFDSTLMLQSLERVDRAERATEVHINVWWIQSQIEVMRVVEDNLIKALVEKVEVIKRVSLLKEFGINRDFFTDYPEHYVEA